MRRALLLHCLVTSLCGAAAWRAPTFLGLGPSSAPGAEQYWTLEIREPGLSMATMTTSAKPCVAPDHRPHTHDDPEQRDALHPANSGAQPIPHGEAGSGEGRRWKGPVARAQAPIYDRLGLGRAAAGQAVARRCPK